MLIIALVYWLQSTDTCRIQTYTNLQKKREVREKNKRDSMNADRITHISITLIWIDHEHIVNFRVCHTPHAARHIL